MSSPTDRSIAAVVHVPYPADATRLAILRARGVPRLLIVASHSPPPVSADPLEDWVRVPADPVELRLRTELLAARRDEQVTQRTVCVDDDGVARRGGRTVVLTVVEHPILVFLLERQGTIVPQPVLEGLATSAGSTMRLSARMARLRRTIAPLGLQLHAVRGRGYLLEIESACPPS